MTITKSTVLIPIIISESEITLLLHHALVYKAARLLRQSAAIILHNLTKQNIKYYVTKSENKTICSYVTHGPNYAFVLR